MSSTPRPRLSLYLVLSESVDAGTRDALHDAVGDALDGLFRAHGGEVTLLVTPPRLDDAEMPTGRSIIDHIAGARHGAIRSWRGPDDVVRPSRPRRPVTPKATAPPADACPGSPTGRHRVTVPVAGVLKCWGCGTTWTGASIATGWAMSDHAPGPDGTP